MDPATWTFEDDGVIPNSRLPVLIYDDVAEADEADACERLFARHGWLGAWRDEHDEVRANIARVPLPDTDPVSGAGGPLRNLWVNHETGN